MNRAPEGVEIGDKWRIPVLWLWRERMLARIDPFDAIFNRIAVVGLVAVAVNVEWTLMCHVALLCIAATISHCSIDFFVDRRIMLCDKGDINKGESK